MNAAMDITMDLTQFRQEVGDFLDTIDDQAILEAGRKTTSVFSPFDEAIAFQKILHSKGWAAATWPVEHGGTGWDLKQQRIFGDECRKRQLPFLLPHCLGMVGPAIIKYGTDEQKARYLPKIVNGDDFWAQGYSEPNAGSDLVSLKCSAVRDGDDYVINGSKTWTTYAQHANRMFMLVRTNFDGKPQAGITFLLFDSMDLPGMEIRQIVGLDGLPEQCEVFFDNVRVPVSSALGAENDGWTVAKYLLEHERSTAFATYFYNELNTIKTLASQLSDGFGGKLVDDALFQQRYAKLYADVTALDASQDYLESLEKGRPEAGPVSSMIKITWTELMQDITEFLKDTAGVLSAPMQLQALHVGTEAEPIFGEVALTAMPKYLNNRACSIYGGSNEVQRTIVSDAVLGRLKK